ncbi:hypothetical protein [Paracoccus sp. (in: a-proteobacteria)]|uniref:hypothetical protein n=1 Tax=Paracoccus sp. TaxID=267 RepID=UPI0028B0173C|nr:hypothetical protein [Paracoccus sp. (in: a-proteobacteria)]
MRGAWLCILFCGVSAAQAQEEREVGPLDHYKGEWVAPPVQPDKRPQTLARCSSEFALFATGPEDQISDEFLRIALASDSAANADGLQNIRANAVGELQALLIQSDMDTIERSHALFAHVEFQRICAATMELLIAEGVWTRS